ncbi:MAG: type II secretion system F family protein [Mycobacteriales bacterium]
MGALLGLLLGTGLLLLRPGGSTRRAGMPAWRRRADLLRQAGVDGVTAGQLLAVQALAAALAGALVLALTGSAGIACCFGVFGAVVPAAAVRRTARRRAADRRELWPDAVDHLASAVRAGLSLPEALIALGERGPVPLRSAFVTFAADHRSSARLAEPLDRLRDRLADPVADRVVETVRLAREVGGSDLGLVLRSLSAFLREDARVRAELEARQSWTVNAARLAVAAPWLVLLLLGSQPGTLAAYDSGVGMAILAAGAGACAVAYRVMVRIGRLPVERRVLR